MGEVMTHPLDDYEQKLTERRKQSHQPSSQVEKLRQELQKSKQHFQQEKQQILLDKQQIEEEKHQLHWEKLRLQQELYDSQERERQILERERILLQQLQQIQLDKTSHVQESQNESSWIISREEIHNYDRSDIRKRWLGRS